MRRRLPSRPSAAQAWLGDATRTTYLLDVRTAEEFAADGLPGFVHAPGGQLVQATDQWVGVRGARIVLYDGEAVRAPVIAGWLRQLGHEAYWLADAAAAASLDWRRSSTGAEPRMPPSISVEETVAALRTGHCHVLDLRPGMTYRKGHIARCGLVDPAADRRGAAAGPGRSSSSPTSRPWPRSRRSISPRPGRATFACWPADTPRGARPACRSTPRRTGPTDAECIDFLFFTHGRHDGNAEAARQYLAWETGLLAQLDDQERGVFRLATPAPSP